MTPEEIVRELYPAIDACTCDKCRRKALRLIRKAIREEREACARMAEGCFVHGMLDAPQRIAAAIRARHDDGDE